MASDQKRPVVVLPGRSYGASAPLLMYAGLAATARGARLYAHEWVWPDGADPAAPTDTDRVCEQVVPLVDRAAAEHGPPLLIGKSLGSLAAPLATERALPAVWLTPLLTYSEAIVTALRAAPAPRLLVGGTADPSWDGTLARELSPHVLEVPGADHGMFVPGRLAASAAVLGRVATAVEDWLDDLDGTTG